MFNVRPLLIEIGRRIGNYDFQEISYFREQEIIDWQTVDKKEVARRMQNFFLFAIEPNKIIFSSDPEQIRKIETKYLEQEKVDLKKIKGSVAFRGKVVGRVVIVLSKKDLPKVERGDVIVSTMTTPDYIVAMEKAAAFITDEGGITCHAAIVSRELKKPCIIGTKIATQVLKDGDLVEVDANNGVVKIMNSK
jgi:pyruvate,water dikinase